MPHSLQCPQCDGAVSINDRDAGSRVKCPHCDNTFVAPGTKASANDDDDWLRLEDDETPTAVPLDAPSMTEPGGGDSTSDESIADFDDFVGSEEPLPLGANDVTGGPAGVPDVFNGDGSTEPAEFGSGTGEEDLFSDLPPMEIPSLAPAPSRPNLPDDHDAIPGLGPPVKLPDSNAPPAAAPTEYQSEFRLNCHVCGSLLYVKATQEGEKVKCSDCFSMVLVPPPPKVRKSASINIENAETFQFEEPPQDARREDPFRKSAADLLQEAEGAEPDKTPDDFETPDIMEWARKVFGIFADLNVALRLVIFTVVGAVPAYFALAMESRVATLGLFIGGTLFAAPLIACGFAILQSVANDEPNVEDWPSMDPMEWLGSAGVAFAAIGFAGVPVLFLSQVLFDNPLIIVATTMLSIYVVFPFVLLSMLDMQSIAMPFSPEVARSVSSSQESWGGFYFSAGLLFFGLFLLFVASAGSSAAVAAFVNVGGTVGLVFAYFAMIGRLAFAIGQTVNAPPREPDDGKPQDETPNPTEP